MTEPKPRGWFGRTIRIVLFASVVSSVIALGTAAWLYRQYIVQEPGDHLDREHIQRLISQESPVYYRDGTTKIGVFFDEQHRQYVPFEDMPKAFVDALVAAEDQDYWDHFGFSVRGISRAMVQNIQAGRVVAGGSTLTQQTAKNLFKRRARTLEEKLKELINGLRLEAHYSKEEILEFYSNQFYVNGNGRGLGIAARFFFDKNVDELELVECAFIAGVVKSPERYNPWVADEARRTRNRGRSHERARYVLRRMLEDGRIDQATHDAAAATRLPFSRGQFRFQRSVVLDEVERELGRSPIREVLASHGIHDPGTAGLRITTTLDKGMQEAAVYGLRHHLTDAGVQLESPAVEKLFGPAPKLRPKDPDSVVPHSFHRGILTAVDVNERTATVELGGIEGTLDPAAHKRLALAIAKARAKNTWTTVRRRDVKAFLKEVTSFIGKAVTVSIRELEDDGTPVLDWEVRTELQGAVLVLDQGEVRAMVGGARNADFNRAAVAKRQFGSTWKPFIFQAALQLGWSSTDMLDNDRAVFPYQTTFYFPRPDHRGAPEKVSMAWATAKSENLASVALLYHLTDRLNEEQFRRVAEAVDMLPRAGEGAGEFVRRVQDEGVLPTESKLLDGLFDRSKEDLLVDLAFDGRDAEGEVLERMRYGRGFDEELERLEENPEDLGGDELGLRRDILRSSFLRQEALAATFGDRRKQILDRVREGERPDASLLEGLHLIPDPSPRPRVGWAEVAPDGWEPLTDSLLTRVLSGESPLRVQETTPALSEEEPDAFDLAAEEQAADQNEEVTAEEGGIAAEVAEPAEPASEASLEGEAAAEDAGKGPAIALRWVDLLDPGRVRLEGRLTPRTVERVRAALSVAREALGSRPELYSPTLLTYCRDYRVLVNLRYVERLARMAGVRSDITRVLSLPLGSSDVTLLEAALMYQLIQRGETYRFFSDALVPVPAGNSAAGALVPPEASVEDGALPSVGMVSEVRSADGTLIFRLDRDVRPVHEPALSAEVTAMLGAVVNHGTGGRARGRVRPAATEQERREELAALGVSVPLFGKTGTTNSYRNSAFVGFVPGIAEGDDRLRASDGVVVATYVGYDDNREMRRGSIRLAGASGSLPVWIEAARGVARSARFGDRIDLADLAFSSGDQVPVAWPKTLVPTRIDLRTGLVPEEASGIEAVGGVEEDEPVTGTTILYRRSEPRTFTPLPPPETVR